RPGVDSTKVKAALADLFEQTTQTNLALLFSLRHDFPTEWSAFANGKGDFAATIRRDCFPYFTQGKTITVTAAELYDGEDVSRHHAIGTADAWSAATAALGSNQAFTVTIPEDSSGSTPDVMTRRTAAQVFLIVQYTLGT